MGAVDIGVGHDDNAMVAQVFQIKGFANAGPHGRNKGPDLIIAQNLIQMSAFSI